MSRQFPSVRQTLGCIGPVSDHRLPWLLLRHPRQAPGIDHAGQLHQLRDEAAGVAQIRTSRCLDACEQSNIVVVAPSSVGRAAGAQAVWLQRVLDDEAITDTATSVRDGGPGVAEPPSTLDLYLFKPSRRVRTAAQ